MNSSLWITAVRIAGLGHFVTLVLACLTPVPAGWNRNLAALPEVHRRFALAQNVAIGGVIAFAGLVSLLLASELAGGSLSARAICAGIGLWWGGRLVILPWLRIWPELGSARLRVGFALLHLECLAFAFGYLWLAIRPT